MQKRKYTVFPRDNFNPLGKNEPVDRRNTESTPHALVGQYSSLCAGGFVCIEYVRKGEEALREDERDIYIRRLFLDNGTG